MQSALPGSLSLTDDSQSADGQLQLGLQLIQQSYTRRAEELQREVEHWKRVAQHHKQQEAQTRDELTKSNQKVADFQRQLHEKQQENQTLNEARNVALQQIATLKKHASQLQNFKKNISTMLQMDNGLGNLDHGLNIQGMLDNLPVDSTFSSTLPSPAMDYGHASLRAGSVGGQGAYFNGADPYTPAPTGSANSGPRALDGPGYPHMGGSASLTKSGTPPGGNGAEVTLDAATYYQQVKRVLEPDQFREFSANIKKLNAGQQSVDETLEKVREIFGEHRPFLFAQLQKLIRQAEEEARRQQGDGADYGM